MTSMTHEDPARNETPSYRTPETSAPLDWRRAHEELSRFAKTRARLDWEEGTLLLCALRSSAHVHLGFGSFAEYSGRLFGYSSRWIDERLRVAEALDGLPELAQSLRDGAISWSAVRELTRVASPQNEHRWLEVAKGRTLRQVEEMVAGRKHGDEPSDPMQPSLRRHVLRFEVSGETVATFRDAMAMLRRASGESLDDDAALLLLARHVLGGPTDAGRANYQLRLTVCEGCGRGWQEGGGEPIEVGSDVVEMARCDVQHLGCTAPATGTPTHVGANQEETDVIPVVDAEPSTRGPVATSTTPLPRARQDVPPAVRRAILRRDNGRCVVPGCRHATFLDLHHVELRSEGGDHDPDKLVVLCSAHHRAQHRGQLIIEGRVSTGLRFHHSDGVPYGAVVDPHLAEAYTNAFHALRSLGFREGEVRRALDRIRAKALQGEVNTERLLREALAALSAN
jgi:hypothetical protein